MHGSVRLVRVERRRVSGTRGRPKHGLDGSGAAGDEEARAGKHRPFFDLAASARPDGGTKAQDAWYGRSCGQSARSRSMHMPVGEILGPCAAQGQ